MDNKLLNKIKWQLGKPLDFTTPFSTLSDVKRVGYKEFVITDPSKRFTEVIRLIALRVGVAPVCFKRIPKIIRVYGERENIRVFSYVYTAIDNYRTNNQIARLRENLEPGKKFKESRILTHYRITRDGVLDYLTSNPPAKDYRRTQYLYSLYLYVAKMEKLDRKNWGSQLDENTGYHYITKQFYNKRILG